MGGKNQILNIRFLRMVNIIKTMTIKKLNIVTVSTVILCIMLAVYFYKDVHLVVRRLKYENAMKEALVYNKPDKLKKFFLKDVENSINDEYTKSSIFLIINRYVVNGGNIYEVYDFVNSNQKVSFLNEAEVVYPIIFNDLKNRKIQLTYSDKGLYVYLAYLETLVKNDYGNNAIFGTLIGQYAKSSYYKKKIIKEKAEGGAKTYPNYSQEEINNDTEKALLFIDKYRDTIVHSMNSTSSLNQVKSRDLLEGVTQYASGLRYLEQQASSSVYSKESREMFNSATVFSYHFVKDYYLLVSLSNASTLLLLSSSTSNELRNAIYPFLSFNSKKEKQVGMVAGIIGAKYRRSVSKFAELSIDSNVNIVSLGNRVPEFKKWLIYNGWNENDFK
jgi:hypothetical protein